MKFPIKHCLPTSLLTQETYSELICKLVTEGYTNTISNLQIVSLVKMWDYLGVGSYNSIYLYDDPAHYMDVNIWQRSTYKQGINVLTEEFLWKYLYES